MSGKADGCFVFRRAAMKMAELDTAFNFMFTNPKDSLGVSSLRVQLQLVGLRLIKLAVNPLKRSKIEDDEPLYFCDICSG